MLSHEGNGFNQVCEMSPWVGIFNYIWWTYPSQPSGNWQKFLLLGSPTLWQQESFKKMEKILPPMRYIKGDDNQSITHQISRSHCSFENSAVNRQSTSTACPRRENRGVGSECSRVPCKPIVNIALRHYVWEKISFEKHCYQLSYTKEESCVISCAISKWRHVRDY